MNFHYVIKPSPRGDALVFCAQSLGEALEEAKKKFETEEPVWTGSRPCPGKDCSCSSKSKE